MPHSIKKTVTVLLADDDSNYRKALKAFLEVDGTIRVIGEAKNGSVAVRMASNLSPDVIVLDISMPVMDGLEACRQIMATNTASKILLLSANDDEEYVKRAKDQGAYGYLIKIKATRSLHKAIHATNNGKSIFKPSKVHLK